MLVLHGQQERITIPTFLLKHHATIGLGVNYLFALTLKKPRKNASENVIC